MTGRLRANAKLDLDSAVAAGRAPKAGAGGVGLSVDIPGKRPRMLVNQHGAVTPHGTYFFDATGREAPSGFDYQQLPVRSGQRHMIMLLDGTMKAVQIYNLATNTFKTTALGKKYFAKAKDRYTVSFPVIVNVARTNGSLYQREDWLPSTALPNLGEIEVSRELPEQQQIAAVRRKVNEYLRTLPKDYVDAAETHEAEVLLPGNESGVASLLDHSREIEYNKLSISAQGDVTAVLHRPLRQARPWRFDFAGAVSYTHLTLPTNREV